MPGQKLFIGNQHPGFYTAKYGSSQVYYASLVSSIRNANAHCVIL